MEIIRLKQDKSINCEDCCLCGSEQDACDVLGIDCGVLGGFIMLEKEPKKIQSEYEHKIERYELLRKQTTSGHLEEAVALEIWLNDNQPETWEICTKENTRVGDEVRVVGGFPLIIRIVESFGKDKKHFMLYDSGRDYSYGALMTDFEVDTYKNRGEE